MSALSDKDANATMDAPALPPIDMPKDAPKDTTVNSMEYHRKILVDKIAQQGTDQQAQYVSPSDNLMSPCTAKLSALRNKKMEKSIKPKSLFQKASARNLGSGLFDSKPVAKAPVGPTKPPSLLAASMTPTSAPEDAEPEAQPKDAEPEPEAEPASDKLESAPDVEMKTD